LKNERRTTRRRRLPFVRSAILETDGRSHVVAVSDLSAEGAFLAARAPLQAKRDCTLRLVLPRDGRVMALACQVVRQIERFDPHSGHPAGIAVRFQGLDAAAIRRIEEFSMEGFLPAVEPVPQEHLEYQVLRRPCIDPAELSRMGLDGWELASALPVAEGVELILMRRL
jgi:hypothetical protein